MPKYAGIGGAVLTTAVFAMLSSTFALQMALDVPLLLALLFGIGWGIAILNLDRWLVAANTRQAHWWQNILVALPRVAMALVIGVVMSTPFVLQLFEDELDSELAVMHQEEQAAFEQQLLADPRYTDLPDMRAEILALQRSLAGGVPADAVLGHPEVQDLTRRLDAVSTAHDAAEQAVACEKDGTCGSGRVGAGPAYAEKLERRSRLSAERAELASRLAVLTTQVRAQAEAQHQARAGDDRQRLDTLQQKVAAAEQARAAEVAVHAERTRNADGLLARIEALERLSRSNPTLHLAHLVLLLFLTTIESLPVLVKLFQSFGKPTRYETLVQQEDSRLLDARRQEMQREIDEMQLEIALELDRRQVHAHTELEAEQELARMSRESRIRLGRLRLQRWEAQQVREEAELLYT